MEKHKKQGQKRKRDREEDEDSDERDIEKEENEINHELKKQRLSYWNDLWSSLWGLFGINKDQIRVEEKNTGDKFEVNSEERKMVIKSDNLTPMNIRQMVSLTLHDSHKFRCMRT